MAIDLPWLLRRIRCGLQLVALVTVAVCSTSRLSAEPGRDGLAELVQEVRRDRDEVDPRVFGRIAAVRTPQAVAALQRCAEWVRDPRVINALFQAFRDCRGDLAIEGQALSAVESLCLEADPRYSVPAVRTLAAWGPAADAALTRVIREHKNGDVRSRACVAVALSWAAEGDAARLRLLIQNLKVAAPVERRGGGGRGRGGRGREPEPRVPRAELRNALSAPRGKTRPVLIEALLESETSPAWRYLLLEVLGPDPARDVTEALVALVKGADAVLALDALHRLGKREGAEEYLRAISAQVRSKSAEQRRAAVVALGKLSRGDEDWPRKLFKLAAKRDTAVRMGACHALADMGTNDALRVLQRLLEDDAWQVRAEALWQLASVRRKDTIPLLLLRLETETPRLREDVARALRLLTGKDLGRLPARWQEWWRAEGDGFQLPPLTVALAAEGARATGAGEGRSASSFFGLRILSDRVCFILDTSGSMNQSSGGGRGRTQAGEGRGTSRLTAAKRELVRALEDLPDGDRFNMIFFADRAEAWRPKLTAMARGPRAQASEFTSERRAVGGTGVYDALALAFRDEDIDTIYLLTDGEPTVGKVVDPERLRRVVGAWNETRRIRIHAISVGRDSELLRGLAEDSGGRYERIE